MAKSQKIQEQIHRILYCDTDWQEHDIYMHRFRKIVDRSDLNEEFITIDSELIKEFKRRVERKLNGNELLDKSLVFYQILNSIYLSEKTNYNELKDKILCSENCLRINLTYLEKSAMIERTEAAYRLSNKTKKLILKQM